MAQQPDHVRVMRSKLGRARGLGAAKAGTHHWWVERMTAAALVPLSLWFVVSVLGMLGAGQPQVAAWIGHPINAALLLALILLTFHHGQLGMQVVYEDYIPGAGARTALVLATKAAALLLALVAVLSVAKIFVAAH